MNLVHDMNQGGDMTKLARCCGILGVASECVALCVGAWPSEPARSPFPTDDVPAEALEALSQAVASYVEAGDVVGAELLVRQHGRTLLDKGWGWKDCELGAPMQPGVVFNIRSMTKSMVGVVAQMLVDEGRLGFDDPVARYLPGFERPGSGDITIDHLLTHRSGLPLSVVTGLAQYGSLFAMGNAIGERGPDVEPGSRFWYSDAGANALGAVIEVVEGAPLAEVLHRRIVEPLGLTGTFPGSDAADPRWGRVAPMYARLGHEWFRAWSPANGAFYPFVWGSQGMLSTPADYARFLEAVVAGGAGDDPFLSSRAVASMIEPVSRLTSLGSDVPEPTGFSQYEVRYGRMLEVRVPLEPSGTSEAVVGHSGSDGTIVWVWPERELVVAYFTQSRGNGTHLRLEQIIDRVILHPGGPVARSPRA